MLHIKGKWLHALAGAAAMMALAATAGAQTQTPGLLGQYYMVDTTATTATSPDRTIVFTPKYQTGARVDPVVDFGNPFTLPGTPPHNFALRETGYFIAPTAGDYLFTCRSDDGNRLWVRTTPIDPTNVDTADIDAWVDRGEGADDPPVTVTLKAGQKAYILYEMYENGGGNAARLRCQGPADTATSICPAADLFHDAPAASTPPTAVTDLKATNPTSTGVTLTLTAPSSKDASGNALDYDVRYSLAPITAATWASATSATITSGAPGAAGKPDSITIGALSAIQHYYFALVAGDSNGLFSALSNVTDATTPPITTGLTAQFFAYDTTLGGSPDRTLVFDPMGQNGAPGLVVSTIVPLIDIVWPDAAGLGGAAPGVPNNKFAVRYTGTITVATTGAYNFYIASDDGVRLWISDKAINPDSDTPLSDGWVDRGNTEDPAAPITLTAGTHYNILVEYYENGGGNEVHLKWDGPGITKEVVPTSVFTPDPTIKVPTQGRITGNVTDSSGGQVAAATVTLTPSTGSAITTTADGQGAYSLLLNAGAYTLSAKGASAAGVVGSSPTSSAVTVTGSTFTAGPNLVINTGSLPSLAKPVDKVVYYDNNYSTNWITDANAQLIRDTFVGKGYKLVDGPGLGTFMSSHATSKVPSVVVMGNDIYPDTVVDLTHMPVDNKNIINDYLNSGGRVVQAGDWPFYNIGITGGGNNNLATNGGPDVFGFQVGTFPTAVAKPVITPIGKAIGLTSTDWNSQRPVAPGDVDVVLDTMPYGAAGWVKFFPNSSGPGAFLRTIDDAPGATPLTAAELTDMQTLAELNGPWPTVGGGGPPALLLGDPLGLGKITIADATTVLQYAVGLGGPSDAQKTASDVNKDGKIDIKDVTSILKAIVNGTGF